MDDRLGDDRREFLSLMISKRVKFLLLGGHAVSVHATPRMTEDLDVFVEVSPLNAKRLRAVLVELGFGDAAPSAEQRSHSSSDSARLPAHRERRALDAPARCRTDHGV